jgi:hypothetical protein
MNRMNSAVFINLSERIDDLLVKFGVGTNFPDALNFNLNLISVIDTSTSLAFTNKPGTSSTSTRENHSSWLYCSPYTRGLA